jgi:hypothetical protein
MGPRINIQYSVDMDALDVEVERLLSDASTALQEVAGMQLPTLAPVLSLQTVQDIDLLRRKLASVDHSLRDISIIIASYVAFQAELVLPQDSQAPTAEALEALAHEEAENEVSS